jgi:hypothetical protein
MGFNDRVILVKGGANKWYDQAIFIVNKNLPSDKIPKDFVREAENIIRDFMDKKNKQAGLVKAYAASVPPESKPAIVPRPVKGNKRFDTILNMVMLLGCITIAAVFLYGMLS